MIHGGGLHVICLGRIRDPKEFAEAVSPLAKGAHKLVMVTWMGVKDIEKERDCVVN